MLAQQLLQMCDLQKDLSKAMLEQGKAKAEAQRLDSAMEFVVGDMENLDKYLPGRRGYFDVITCSAAVPFLQDPFKALDLWKYWLAPGGKLAFNAFVPPAIEEFATFRHLAAQYGFGDVKDPCDALGSEQLVTEAMQAAGYVSIEVVAEHKERQIPAASPEEHAEKFGIRHYIEILSVRCMVKICKSCNCMMQYIAAVVQELDSSGRYNAEQQHVVNRYTVMYALGSVSD